MSVTYTQATDIMFSEFSRSWGDACFVIWQGQPITPPENAIWAEVFRTNLLERQATLSNTLGISNGRRYETNGILSIVLRCPISLENSYLKLSELAQTAKEIYRGRRLQNEIVFQQCRIIENGVVDNNLIVSVLCNYTYWEVSQPVLYLPDDVWLNGGVYMAGQKPLPRGLWSNGGVIMTTGAVEYENTINNGGVLCGPV